MFSISNSKQQTIGFFGEAMVEFGGSPYQLSYGGDVLNTAVYLSRLIKADSKKNNAHLSIHFISAVGDDTLSDSMLQRWSEEGIDTNWVTRIPGKQLGLYIVNRQESGERIFHYWRNDSAIRSYFSDVITPLEKALESNVFDMFYLTGTSLAVLHPSHRNRLIVQLEKFKNTGGKIIFDNNYRAQLWKSGEAHDWYLKILNLTDVAFLTDDDEKQLFGSDDPTAIYKRSRQYGITEIVIKRGENPCVVFESEVQEPHFISGETVFDIEDTCAAGDSFAAGYLSERLFGGSVTQSAKRGHKLASKVLKYPGAIIPVDKM